MLGLIYQWKLKLLKHKRQTLETKMYLTGEGWHVKSECWNEADKLAGEIIALEKSLYEKA